MLPGGASYQLCGGQAAAAPGRQSRLQAAHLCEAVGLQDHLAILLAQVVRHLAVGAQDGQALGVGHVGAQAQHARGLHGDDGVVACAGGRVGG
jgi:hypothetical protein